MHRQYEHKKATVAAQQKTLEDLQQEKRSKNIVITGVPEPEEGQNPTNAHQADKSTVDEILTAVGCPGIAPCRVTRLGNKRTTGAETETDDNQRPQPPRPLLVTLGSVNDVRSVLLKKSEGLKEHAVYKSCV